MKSSQFASQDSLQKIVQMISWSASKKLQFNFDSLNVVDLIFISSPPFREMHFT